MGNRRFGHRRVVALTLATFVALVLAAPAVAASGDVLADLAPAGAAGGRSVAFDGQHLYYTDRTGTVLHRVGPDGSGAAQAPIVGAAGLNALAYDATRDAFWGVDLTGLNVYVVQKNGVALPHFTIVPALDLPGSCNSLLGCSPVVSIAYDGTDDTLWYVPEGSTRVYHFDTVGHPLGFFDPNLAPQCPFGTVSGIAAGRTGLYLSAGTCLQLFGYDKNGARLTAFGIAGSRVADVECDSSTFTGHAGWVRDDDGHLRAVALPPSTCVTGGGVLLQSPHGWLTGGGELVSMVDADMDGQTDLTPVHHGFRLDCPPSAGEAPQGTSQLQVTWTDALGRHYRFHLVRVVAADCSNDPSSTPDPPPCDETDSDCFDTYVAIQSSGRFTGESLVPGTVFRGQDCNRETFAGCATANWRFQDRGEPGSPPNPAAADLGELFIFDPAGNLVLFACACLEGGNYQAHQAN